MIKIPKKTKKKLDRSILKPIAKYIKSIEIYIPQFKKIINKGDLVPEMSIDEAKARRDFIVVNERKD